MYLNAFFFEHKLNTSCGNCFMVVELHFCMIFLYFSGIDCIKHIWSNALIFVLCIFDHCSLVLNSLVSKLYTRSFIETAWFLSRTDTKAYLGVIKAWLGSSWRIGQLGDRCFMV